MTEPSKRLRPTRNVSQPPHLNDYVMNLDQEYNYGFPQGPLEPPCIQNLGGNFKYLFSDNFSMNFSTEMTNKNKITH